MTETGCALKILHIITLAFTCTNSSHNYTAADHCRNVEGILSEWQLEQLPADTVFRDQMCIGGDATSFLFDVGCECRIPAELSSICNALRHAERVGLEPWPHPRLKAAQQEVSLCLQCNGTIKAFGYHLGLTWQIKGMSMPMITMMSSKLHNSFANILGNH